MKYTISIQTFLLEFYDRCPYESNIAIQLTNGITKRS